MAGLIHPTAIIDPSAEISPDAEIGAYCVVGPKVRIGSRTRLMPRVTIQKLTAMEQGNTVYPGAVLGAAPQDKKYGGEESWLEIGSKNTFRENVTVNRGTAQGSGHTRIGSDCLVMAGCHIAHDCILGDGVTMANGVLLGGHVIVEDGVGFGGLTAVHHFVSVGRCAFVGGMSRVSTDCPPYLITEGHPARVRAVNRVGLKRNGVTDETVAWLKEAQRLLYHDGLVLEEAIARLASRGTIPPEGHRLIEFLRNTQLGRQGRALQPRLCSPDCWA
ncbi:MAG: acyl-ACP--UDP-N-acetylglucosamine O-acyltransferase, partial [Planctomycetota bacterium]